MHRSLPRVQHYWSRADQRVLAWSAGCGSRDRAWPGGCVDRRRSAGRWVPSPSHALGVARCRRAVRVRSGITATVAARTAALTAMRVICRPGMPPTITAWVLVAGGAGAPGPDAPTRVHAVPLADAVQPGLGKEGLGRRLCLPQVDAAGPWQILPVRGSTRRCAELSQGTGRPQPRISGSPQRTASAGSR